MKILFLHGWHSVVGGVKPTYLKDAGHEVINPALDDDDFEAAVRTAQTEFDQHKPDVIVGSSRGGAVAMNIESGETPLVLLCPAWKNWGTATKLKANSIILHSRADEVISFGDSEDLLSNSSLPSSALVEVGKDHRLADSCSLREMEHACKTLRTPPLPRSIFLAGESIPLLKGGGPRPAIPFGGLPTDLSPLDARHGVFPNLVAKPMFSALVFANRMSPERASTLLGEFDRVLTIPDRQFNVFQAKVTDQKVKESNFFEFHDSFASRLDGWQTNTNLWLVFGYQTLGGILMHLLGDAKRTTRSKLQGRVGEFVDACWDAVASMTDCTFEFPPTPPTTGSAKMGFVHRLCVSDDQLGTGAKDVLKRAISETCRKSVKTQARMELIHRRLRSMVPLMHNEAYQTGSEPIGNRQHQFSIYARNPAVTPDLYWHVMGEAVARRSFGEWIID